MFVVEDGTEKAKSSEEVAALKIQKLMQMLQLHVNELQLLTPEILFKC